LYAMPHAIPSQLQVQGAVTDGGGSLLENTPMSTSVPGRAKPRA